MIISKSIFFGGGDSISGQGTKLSQAFALRQQIGRNILFKNDVLVSTATEQPKHTKKFKKYINVVKFTHKSLSAFLRSNLFIDYSISTILVMHMQCNDKVEIEVISRWI